MKTVGAAWRRLALTPPRRSVLVVLVVQVMPQSLTRLVPSRQCTWTTVRPWTVMATAPVHVRPIPKLPETLKARRPLIIADPETKKNTAKKKENVAATMISLQALNNGTAPQTSWTPNEAREKKPPPSLQLWVVVVVVVVVGERLPPL